jgi:hypothetical protein
MRSKLNYNQYDVRFKNKPHKGENKKRGEWVEYKHGGKAMREKRERKRKNMFLGNIEENLGFHRKFEDGDLVEVSDMPGTCYSIIEIDFHISGTPFYRIYDAKQNKIFKEEESNLRLYEVEYYEFPGTIYIPSKDSYEKEAVKRKIKIRKRKK